MKIYDGKIDDNDLAHFYRLFHEMPIAARPCPIGKGNKINPQTTRFLKKDGQLVDIFHIKPIYYQHLNDEWRPLSEITYGFGNSWAILNEWWQQKANPIFIRWWMKRMEILKGKGISVPMQFPWAIPILNVTLTKYPDPDPGTTSFDGTVGAGIVGNTWNFIRTTSGNAAYTLSATDPDDIFNIHGDATGWDEMHAAMFLFDTSSIGGGSTITAGSNTISFFGTSKIDNYSQSIVVIDSNPTSNTASSTADYYKGNNRIGGTNTKQTTADITNTNWSTTAYNDFTLSATGEGNISKTGITKFGTTCSGDQSNTDPGFVNGTRGQAKANFSEQAGTTKDPKLVVVYTKSSINLRLTMMGIGQ